MAAPAGEAWGGTRIPSVVAGPTTTAFVTMTQGHLYLRGGPFRFAGANAYWLGLDENIRDGAGNPTHPTHARINSALTTAAGAGLRVVRSHSLGISVGCATCLEPKLGVFNDSQLDSADYAIYRAGQLGLKLMIPLTDEWRFYHGGKSVFVGWRAGQSGIVPPLADKSETVGNSNTEKTIEQQFYASTLIQGDFKAYISHLLNHVNPYTGLALKNDPAIMAWETGNEMWDSNPAWTQNIASFIKHTVGARQLVADGSAADGMHVANAGINDPDVDILGGHFYPVDATWARSDAAVAVAHGKAYVIGEYNWMAGGANTVTSLVNSDRDIAGDMPWNLLPKMDDGRTNEPTGGPFAFWPGDPILGVLAAHAKTLAAQ